MHPANIPLIVLFGIGCALLLIYGAQFVVATFGRFTLRAMLYATTFIAAVFGLGAWLAS